MFQRIQILTNEYIVFSRERERERFTVRVTMNLRFFSFFRVEERFKDESGEVEERERERERIGGEGCVFIFRVKGEARFFHEVEEVEVISTRDETNETSVRPEYQRPLHGRVTRSNEVRSLLSGPSVSKLAS